MKSDIWIKKARLVCGGCEDVSEVTKEITLECFEAVVEAFDARHGGCAKQSRLPTGK